MKHRLIALVLSTLFSAQASFAQPTITDIDLRGIQIGHSTELTISGQNLTKGTQVFFPFDLVQQTVEENGSNRLKVKITPGKNIAPGMYPMRVFNSDGLSDPVRVGVDRLPHKVFSQEKQAVPVALSGKLVGAQILKTSFEGKANDRVILEVEANRIGSKLRPVIHVYDGKGKQVAFAQPSRTLGGDSRCHFTVPKAGEYFVELHDFLFRGASPGFFRLKMGQFEYADLCLPVGVQTGQKTSLRLIKVDAESEWIEEVNQLQAGWCNPSIQQPVFSGITPRIFSSNTPEYVETAQSQDPHPVGAVPLGINGRIFENREKDYYEIDVRPKSKLLFDLWGRRIGSLLDAKIVLKTVQGNVLAQNDDRQGEQDALLSYTVPGNLKKLVVEISDVAAKGGPSHVYRLNVFEQSQPSVLATLSKSTINITKNGTAHVPVSLVRQNYNGPVELVFDGLPADYKIAGAKIPAESEVGLVTFSSHGSGPAYISMEAVINTEGKVYRSDVLGPESTFAKKMDTGRKQIALGPINSKQLGIEWKGISAHQLALMGGQIPTSIKLNKSPGLKGPVRVRLVTNQKMPKKRVRKNNKDTFFNDIEKSIRAGTIEILEGKNDGKLNIEFPVEIAEQDWQALLVAELLSADKKKVLLSSACHPVTLTTKRYARVELSAGQAVVLPRSGMIDHPIVGKIDGNTSKYPLRISLAGLPKGITVSPVTVPGENKDFQAVLKIPVNGELLKIKTLKVEFAFLDPDNLNQVIAKDKPQTIKVSVKTEPKNDAAKKAGDKKEAKKK
ncbi:MAG: hypothetical protein VX438_07405 [Planctomycetota bacterium]|nr:hypothetical protein [Planctomycetota bacterium]